MLALLCGLAGLIAGILIGSWYVLWRLERGDPGMDA